MKRFAILIIALVLACGCISSVPGPQAALEPVAQVTIGDLPTAVAPGVTVAPTETPFKYAYKIINGKEHPYVFEKSGHYYPQPEGFVCTEQNPTWVYFFENYTHTSDSDFSAIWCER